MKAVRQWSVRHAAGLERLYEAFAQLAPLLRPLATIIGKQGTERMLAPLERGAKQLMFDCRMCGTCVLRKTGMACPTNCGKSMRNGPCGGVRADGGCEVDPAMRCVWLEARDGMRRISPHDERTGSLPPIDFSRRDRSTWIEVIDGAPERVQPPAPPPRDRPIHAFEAACRSGRFVTTVEIAPPDSADPAALLARAAIFAGLVDAMNITDGAGGNCHMSSAAAAAILAAHGHTPVCQIACRDRNRIAVQGDILGAAALGVRNILCLTGDDVSQGDHPQAKPVFDLDAVNLLRIARDMRDKGEFASGRKLEKRGGEENIIYIGNVELGDNANRLNHAEGRAVDGRVEYFVKDHLGNTRLVLRDADEDRRIERTGDPEMEEVLSEHHYYPCLRQASIRHAVGRELV